MTAILTGYHSILCQNSICQIHLDNIIRKKLTSKNALPGGRGPYLRTACATAIALAHAVVKQARILISALNLVPAFACFCLALTKRLREGDAGRRAHFQSASWRDYALISVC